MSVTVLLLPVLLPAFLALACLAIAGRGKELRQVVSVVGSAANLLIAWTLFGAGEQNFSAVWAGPGIDFHLRLYHFSGFIMLWIALFTFLIAVYSAVKMHDHPRVREYSAYLFLTAALAQGAVLAANFVLLLFFWEALLLVLYGFITLGGTKNSGRTAVKSFIINGFCDFCLILGIAIWWSQTGTFEMSGGPIVPSGSVAAAAFFLMATGAAGKAGAMPFHTWIPDAAVDAPVGFMALLPAALEKLLGIYLLTRITLDFFRLSAGSSFCLVLMIVGALTIVLAVFMALIQKDFKRLLSYHAVSQVGYMILGVGTGVPIGIAGGLFHMVNNAIYKCGLFLSAGSIEHRCGTTDLKKLGGLRREMPMTALGFAVCAAAISGIWPLNGFVSKEMIFHGALETGYPVFAAAAWVGAILTLASFLKAGHSIFLGPRAPEITPVRESEAPIFTPILVLSFLCILFGVYSSLPLQMFIFPVLEGYAEPAELFAFSQHALVVFNPVAGISFLCLLAALVLHLYGWKRAREKAYLASEIVHNFPVLNTLYRLAEARIFDIYEQGVRFFQAMASVVYQGLDRSVDYLYERTAVETGRFFIRTLRSAHNGQYANYLAWCLAGLFAIIGLVKFFSGG